MLSHSRESGSHRRTRSTLMRFSFLLVWLLLSWLKFTEYLNSCHCPAQEANRRSLSRRRIKEVSGGRVADNGGTAVGGVLQAKMNIINNDIEGLARIAARFVSTLQLLLSCVGRGLCLPLL